MDNIQHIEKAITPEMAEVLEHMRYDKETDAILVDCDCSMNSVLTDGKHTQCNGCGFISNANSNERNRNDRKKTPKER